MKTVRVPLFLFFFGCCTLLGQTVSGQISGTVKDASGAVLPGVEIKVTQTNTGATRIVVSNETGSYIISNLPVGPYRLEAALPGFSTYVQSGIVLQVNSNPILPVMLQVGTVNETVQVEANASMVEIHDNAVGQVIDQRRILELPLNGRQATQLILL